MNEPKVLTNTAEISKPYKVKFIIFCGGFFIGVTISFLIAFIFGTIFFEPVLGLVLGILVSLIAFLLTSRNRPLAYGILIGGFGTPIYLFIAFLSIPAF